MILCLLLADDDDDPKTDMSVFCRRQWRTWNSALHHVEVSAILTTFLLYVYDIEHFIFAEFFRLNYYIYMYAYIHVYICTYIYMYAYIHVYICTYIYI